MIIAHEIVQHSIITTGQRLVSWISSTATLLFYLMLGLRVLHFVIFAIRSDAPYPSSHDFVQRMQACFRRFCAAVTSEEAIEEVPPQLYNKTELTQKHLDPIVSRRWKEVLAWIVFHPEELLLLDKRKQSVLHHACLFRAPAQIIEMILFQAPELASIANVDDELPLHWAVRLSAPKEIVRWLLAVNPKSACEAKDKDGNTALSLLWERHDDKILELWWRSAGVLTDVHQNDGWKGILYFLKCHAFATTLCSSNEAPTTTIGLLLSIDDAGEAMDRYLESDWFRVLHAATRCPGCPPVLFSLILKMHHAQLRELDHFGQLPLTWACRDLVSNRSIGAITKVHLLLAEWEGAAHMPCDCCCCTDNGHARLPLFTALAVDMTWEEGIDRLIAVAPRSLQWRDPCTRLPAFLLSASAASDRPDETITRSSSAINKPTTPSTTYCSCSTSRKKTQGNRGDARALSTIYTLLRRDPTQCVASAHHQSPVPSRAIASSVL